MICILGKTVEPLYGGETSRKRVSHVAELKDDIVNTIRLHVINDTVIYGMSY